MHTRHIVIAGGGGGVAVTENNGIIRGVDAVIDKDMTASVLASSVKADILLILTAVSEVALDYNTPEERRIKKMNVKEAKQYINDNEFAPGSMLPKVKACYTFLERNHRGKAIITSLTNAKKALEGKKGTIIIY